MATIKKLSITEALGIRETVIEPGKVNMISGGNGVGKTSILDAIEKAVTNTMRYFGRNTNDQRRPEFVRKGADEAVLYFQTDTGLEVTKKVKPDGGVSTKVVSNGNPIGKPETFLRGMLGGSLNPIDFMRLQPKEQTEILLNMIPAEISGTEIHSWFGYSQKIDPVLYRGQHALRAIKNLEKHFYDVREEANRKEKRLRDEIEALGRDLPPQFDAAAVEAVSLKWLYDRISQAEAVNANIIRAQEVIGALSSKIQTVEDTCKQQAETATGARDAACAIADRDAEKHKAEISQKIADLEKQIEALRGRLTTIDAQTEATKARVRTTYAENVSGYEAMKNTAIDDLRKKEQNAQKYIAEHVTVNIEPLKKDAEEQEKLKGFLSLHDRREALRKQHDEAAALAADLDCKVRICREKPAEIISHLEMPISGLSIDDSGEITINGLPIGNLSTSQQLKLSLDLARKTASDLKVILIDRWEAMDETSKAEFFKQIEGDGFQYFITEVTAGPLKVEVKDEERAAP